MTLSELVANLERPRREVAAAAVSLLSEHQVLRDRESGLFRQPLVQMDVTLERALREGDRAHAVRVARLHDGIRDIVSRHPRGITVGALASRLGVRFAMCEDALRPMLTNGQVTRIKDVVMAYPDQE